MPFPPKDEELESAVLALLAGREDELEDSPGKVAQLLRDDHFMWQIRTDRVTAIIEKKKKARKPPRRVPDELFEPQFDVAVGADIGPSRKWESVSIEGVHHAQGGLGSTGCFLVKIEGDGFIVLKQKTNDSGSDLFATELFRAAGVKCPAMRVLKKEELDMLTEKLRNAKVSVKGTCDEIHAPRFQEAGAIVMEFVKGVDLETRPLSAMELRKLGSSVETLGEMMVVDAVMNNPDRIPSIWRSDVGNAANILVNTSAPTKEVFVAIDQTVNTIRNDAMLSEYMSKVKNLFGPQTVENVRSFFRLNESDSDTVRKIFDGAQRMIKFLKANDPVLIRNIASGVVSVVPDFDKEATQAFVSGNIRALPDMDGESSSGSVFSFFQSLCFPG